MFDMNFCHLFPLGEIHWENFGASKPKMHLVHNKEIQKTFVGEPQMSSLENRCVFLLILLEFS